MLNRNKFKAAVMEHGQTLEKLAEALNINHVTLYRKLNGQSDFTRSEIQNYKIFLDLTDEEIAAIFFA